jgi:hypothetical protein
MHVSSSSYDMHVSSSSYDMHVSSSSYDMQEGPVGLRVCDRVLTALLYLNDNWLPEHGGYLRLYRPEPGREEEVLLGPSYFSLTHATSYFRHTHASSYFRHTHASSYFRHTHASSYFRHTHASTHTHTLLLGPPYFSAPYTLLLLYYQVSPTSLHPKPESLNRIRMPLVELFASSMCVSCMCVCSIAPARGEEELCSVSFLNHSRLSRRL